MGLTAYLLGIAYAATHMTFLRGAAAFGLVELLAAGIAGLSLLLRLPTLLDPPLEAQVRFGATSAARLGKIWLAMLVAACLSLALNHHRFTTAEMSAVSAIAPYVFNGVLLLAILGEAYSGCTLQVLRGYVIASALILIGYVVLMGAGISADRFEGLTTNPNQAALYCLSVLILASALVVSDQSRFFRIGSIVVAALAVLVGRSTQSDALGIAIAISFLGLGLLLLRQLQRFHFDLLFIGILTLIAALLTAYAFFSEAMTDRVEDIMWSLAYGDQDTVRTLLWRNGIEAWRQAPVFGNGPGAWSGVSGPYGGQEAHNTLIDWLTIAGLVGAAPLVWLFTLLARTSWKENLVALTWLVSLISFAFFHFTFRQPSFWLTLFATLAVLKESSRAHRLNRSGDGAQTVLV